MAIYSEFSHEQWWFSIVMLVYQRVNSKPPNKWVAVSSSETIPLILGPTAKDFRGTWTPSCPHYLQMNVLGTLACLATPQLVSDRLEESPHASHISLAARLFFAPWTHVVTCFQALVGGATPRPQRRDVWRLGTLWKTDGYLWLIYDPEMSLWKWNENGG